MLWLIEGIKLVFALEDVVKLRHEFFELGCRGLIVDLSGAFRCKTGSELTEIVEV